MSEMERKIAHTNAILIMSNENLYNALFLLSVCHLENKQL